MVEQGGQIMRLIRDAAAALDEVVHHRRVPTARGIARSWWADFAPVGQLAALGFGQLAGAAWGALVRENGQVL